MGLYFLVDEKIESAIASVNEATLLNAVDALRIVISTDVPAKTDEKKEESNQDIDEKKGNSKSEDGLEELLASMADVSKAAPR